MELQDDDEQDDETLRRKNHKQKKSVHFDAAKLGHIELRDLKEKDFLDLIEAKN